MICGDLSRTKHSSYTGTYATSATKDWSRRGTSSDPTSSPVLNLTDLPRNPLPLPNCLLFHALPLTNSLWKKPALHSLVQAFLPAGATANPTPSLKLSARYPSPGVINGTLCYNAQRASSSPFVAIYPCYRLSLLVAGYAGTGHRLPEEKYAFIALHSPNGALYTVDGW